MRIAPRTLLCGTAFRVGGSGADTGFDGLRDLCTAAGDQRSLAIGLAGVVMAQGTNAHRQEASRLAIENGRLLESIGDPTLTVALAPPAMVAHHEAGRMTELLRVAQRVIDLADGDPTNGNLIIGSPLTLAITMRGVARCCLGIAGWKDDLYRALMTAGAFDALTVAGVTWFTYATAIPYGLLQPDASALRDTAETLALAERSGDDFALDTARTTRGITLVHRDGPERDAGFGLLTNTRETASNGRFSLTILAIADINIARGKARLGHIDGAIELARSVVDDLFASGGCIWSALATSVLVEALLLRGGDGDLEDAQCATDRLAAMPKDPRFVLHEMTLLPLRALLARAHGDETAYQSYRDRYRAMANSLGFEGHIARAEAMT
jgi:adenylate cyclase